MLILTPHTDVESPPHKALRLALGAVSAQLGQATALTPSLRSQCMEALTLLAWHTNWSRRVVFPLVESLDAGATASALQAHEQLAEQIERLRCLISARSHDQDADVKAPPDRLYQHWSLLQASSHALMHTEETVVQATLNHKATASHVNGILDAFRRHRPPTLKPWLEMALPKGDHLLWLNTGEAHA